MQNLQENTCARVSMAETCNFIKKEALALRCFPVKFAKYLRKPFLQMTSKRLLLVFKIFTKQLFFGTPLNCSLREKCPNTGLFLVRIFPHSDWIRRYTKNLSVFSSNTRKYEPEITPYLDTSYAVAASLQNIRMTSSTFA